MIKKTIIFLKRNFKGTDIPAIMPVGNISSATGAGPKQCQCICCYNCGCAPRKKDKL